ncbi:MAG: hypothetical protein ACTS6O_14705, partial [Giesbergeria sp.]
GQVYAKVYGSTDQPVPIGNVLELGLEHDEDVQTQPDMTRLGGGTHSEVRRVKEIKVTMKLADINVTNLARGILGTATDVASGTAADEPHTATLGGLLPLEHIQPTAVAIKVGPDKLTATPVTAPGNFEVRPEGVLVFADAADIDDADKLWVSYSYGEYAAIEALTTKATELQLIFGGLNEADSGKPVVVDVFRISQGVTKKLALISGKDFGALEIEGTVLVDPTKTGTGISRYYKTRMA